MITNRFLLGLVLLAGCQTDKGFDKEATRESMRNLVLSYIAAVESMNVDAVNDKFYDDPEFHIYSDGADLNLAQMKDEVRKNYFRGMKKIETKYDTMNIHVFTPDEAHCFMKLTEVLTDSTGQVNLIDVDVTFSGVRTSKGWKLDYAHAFHKPREK
ncbi:MAG: nuclear transport factor 2 family protein [Cyclobacteriaceae bacterium]